jgi:hypothetical protein
LSHTSSNIERDVETMSQPEAAKSVKTFYTVYIINTLGKRARDLEVRDPGTMDE